MRTPWTSPIVPGTRSAARSTWTTTTACAATSAEQIRSEVERLERRIETLRLIRAPHAAIMIATYQRLIDRKKGFLRNWGLKGLDDT